MDNVFCQRLNTRGSITHIALFSIVGLLALTLVINTVSKQNQEPYSVLGDESSDASVSSGKSETSTKSEDEKSEVSEELLVNSEEASIEEDSVDEVSTPSIESVDEEASTEDLSETDELSVESESVEVSVKESPSIDNFDEEVESDEDIIVVSDKEKLFFLIPVDIEKTLQLDEEDNVVGTQQSLLSRILSFFSF